MPDSLLCWTAWTNRWCPCWWQRRRLWWSSPCSLRHVAFYVLRWFWHPDFEWLVSIPVSKQDITIPVQLVDKRAACKSLDPCGKQKVATLTQCWVVLARANSVQWFVPIATGLSRHARLIQHGRTAWAEGYIPSRPSSVSAKWLHQSSQTLMSHFGCRLRFETRRIERMRHRMR